MRPVYFLLALTIGIALAGTAAAQTAPPDSGTFILGLFHVSTTQPNGPAEGHYTRSYQHYAELKKQHHVNLLFDYYDEEWKNLATAKDLGIWLTGWRNWNNEQDYQGIQMLGSNAEAGKYWAATDNAEYPCFLNGPVPLVGDNHPEVIPEEGTRQVRRASKAAGHKPGILLSNFFSGHYPLFYGWFDPARYLRIYGKITEPVQGNPVVLTVKINWTNNQGPGQQAAWEEGDSGVFYARDLGNNEWALSAPKVLYARNPAGDKVYWAVNVEITWTGACDLEIYYVTISNRLGDQMVYDPAHPLDEMIEKAAVFYNGQPALARHFTVDDPLWANIWSNAYLDQKISESGSTLPFTLGDVVNNTDNPYLVKLWTDIVKHSPNFMTYNYPIKGNSDTLLGVPNPYEPTPPSYADYDRQLNHTMGGLNQLIQYLTGPIWEARRRFDPPKAFWFAPQIGGRFFKNGNGVWAWDVRHTTPEEFRCMAYIAMACGARGIVPYLYYTDTDNGVSDWEVGVVDQNFRHDTNWATLAGVPDQYVGYQHSYQELGAVFRTLEALGPQLMQMQYQDSGFTAPLTHFLLDHGIWEEGRPVADNHIFLSSFTPPTAETDTQTLYFALVNRDCWPTTVKGHKGRHKFDLHLIPNLPGKWKLEDLATHKLYRSKGMPAVFHGVPFEPGQGRVFKLSQVRGK